MDLARPGFLEERGRVWKGSMMGRNKGDDMAVVNNLELRNAIDGIDEISFLLSWINIKTGEEIDLGSKGVYVVKQKEALSIIARDHGHTTKELVKLNPWLFDDNRIEFNYPKKVLIKEGTVISDEKDHILNGYEVVVTNNIDYRRSKVE